MKTAIRGATLTFVADPFLQDADETMRYCQDALLVMEDGVIVAHDQADRLLPALGPDTPVTHYPDALILPGFIDTHVHYAQIEMVAAFGEQLIDWLHRYTYVTEQRFSDPSYASEVAARFLDEQLRNGVTTASVFCTVFPKSVDALFEAAAHRNMRMMAGKVCMDRNAPPELLDSPERAYEESRALIERWHGHGRAEYVITPRFAPTSTVAQLEALGALAAAYPSVAIQSHLSENRDEVAWISRLFPDCANYTDVYRRYGLLRPRAIYGHGIHLAEDEYAMLAESGSALAHCPTSNFFLGSGCFNLRAAKRADRPVAVGLASDLGAGTSFSMLRTMGAAYQAAQLSGFPLTAPQAWYLATRGGAEALGLAHRVGSLALGMEADLVVLNLNPTPFIAYRMQHARDLCEALFILMTLGDDRAISATWVAGRPAWQAAVS
jgi:guanine deaminase